MNVMINEQNVVATRKIEEKVDASKYEPYDIVNFYDNRFFCNI